MRVYELAAELGIDSWRVLRQLHASGEPVRKFTSNLETATAERFIAAWKGFDPAPLTPASMARDWLALDPAATPFWLPGALWWPHPGVALAGEAPMPRGAIGSPAGEVVLWSTASTGTLTLEVWARAPLVPKDGPTSLGWIGSKKISWHPEQRLSPPAASSSEPISRAIDLVSAVWWAIANHDPGRSTARGDEGHSIPSAPSAVDDVRVIPLYVGQSLLLGKATRPSGAATRRWSVRGHWRQQPYGPGRALRKRIWIAEHTAGAADGAALEGPVVYEFRPRPSTTRAANVSAPS